MGKDDPERTPLQSGKTYEAHDNNNINSSNTRTHNHNQNHNHPTHTRGAVPGEPFSKSELDTFPHVQNISGTPTSKSWDNQHALQELIQRTASAFIDVSHNPANISVKEADKRASEYRRWIPSSTLSTQQLNILTIPTVVTSTNTIGTAQLDNILAQKEFIQKSAKAVSSAVVQMVVVEKEPLIYPLPVIDAI